jgi:ubiquitin-protein ligase
LGDPNPKSWDRHSSPDKPGLNGLISFKSEETSTTCCFGFDSQRGHNSSSLHSSLQAYKFQTIMSALLSTAMEPSSFAKRRLIRDLKELDRERPTLLTISAAPTFDLFHWRACLRPNDGPYAGIVFHVKLIFPETYPQNPPDISLCSSIPHPNVFGDWICLDMLKFYTSSTPYEGWTPAYSVTSILLQLQSFLFAENIPQDDGEDTRAYTGDYSTRRAIQAAKQFTCKIALADGTEVVHTHDSPWPPLEGMKTIGQLSALVSGLQSARITPKGSCIPWANGLPASVLSTNIFGCLTTRDIVTARNVCTDWRRVVVTHNVFERSQMSCFYTKKTMDDTDCILGVGISVEYYPNYSGLKSISSSLDVLSLEAFAEEGVRYSVFDKSHFGHLLPLILNRGHAAKARPLMEKTIFAIMHFLPSPPYSNIQRGPRSSERLYPHMILQLLMTLMNSMVVQLMKEGDSHGHVRCHASEKALEGFCSFHHMLLYYSRVYPSIEQMANKEVDDFIASEQARHKKKTPDLGNLLVCLTLSGKGWQFIWKPKCTMGAP